MKRKKEYIIDGKGFNNLGEFTDYFSKNVLVDYTWRGSLDAFNDILRGGFGTPEDGFILRWINSDISREKLGKEATIEWYKERTLNAHPSNRSYMSVKLEEMKQGIGETIFDWIIKIIKIHGEDGDESEDGVELILE